MLSVIICTYNRDKYIYDVLKSLATGTFPADKYEIVLVDNNCTDNTKSECQRFASDFPQVQFRYFLEENQGLSYARNRGIKESGGDILVYVDDDAAVNPEYLKTYSDFFDAHPDVDAAGGPIIPRYETHEPKWFSHYTKALITGYKWLGDKVMEFPVGNYPGGGNAAYRKRVFDRVGLFNVDLGRKGDSLIGAEEKDLFDKMDSIGVRYFYLPTAILYHIIPAKKLTMDYFDRLTFSIGRSERMRTLSIGRGKYLKRLVMEDVKWAATLLLWLRFAVVGQFSKGNKLVRFRWNVSKGLLS